VPSLPRWGEVLSWLVSAAALAAGLGALYQGIVLRRRAEKVSSEMDAVAARLLRIEARLAEPERPAAGLTSTVAEVTGEIALLGGLVRDLAVTVATQDRDVASLKDQVERAKAQPPVPPLVAAKAPPPIPAPTVTARFEERARERLVIPSLLPIAEPSVAQPEPAPRATPPQAPTPLANGSAAPEVDARRFAEILDAFDKDRIELHLQPVVSLPQRKPRFYEILARLRLAGDTILVPAEFLPSLERAGLVADLDRKVLTRAAAIARHLTGRGSEVKVSCNLSLASLSGGILRAAGRIAEAYPDVADRLILEMSQRAWREIEADHAGTIALLRGKGLSFVLDRATDLRLDPLTLAERGVSFVKLPADLLLRPEKGRSPDVEVADLAAVLARAGIGLIVERVEREEDVPDLIDLDVPFAQGFVFAPPRAVRPEVLGGAAAAPASPSSAPAAAPTAPRPAEPVASPTEAAPERKPFRAFLRRAG
jgi:cyclic-di-GMP phosphodiesterase TipF (flagellum assembly factor)